MARKPQNSNDMNSKFERVVRELRAKFRGGELHAKLRWESGAHRGFGASSELSAACLAAIGADPHEGDGPRLRVSGRRTLRGAGRRHRMITILIHIHVRST